MRMIDTLTCGRDYGGPCDRGRSDLHRAGHYGGGMLRRPIYVATVTIALALPGERCDTRISYAG